MKKSKSVYQRMYNDKKLFFLGYGVLYITEMRRVKNLTRTTGLRIKSKGLAETWYNLFNRYNLLSKKSKGIHVKNGIYTFGCSALSLYELLNMVKKLPETEMDLNIRKRLKNITYTGKGHLNKNRIKILKALKQEPFLTNELARQIDFCSGNVFKNHVHTLSELGYIKREKIGKQKVRNYITKKGFSFIKNHLKNIEDIPKNSMYNECFKNKQLAADIILIISELEMGGIMQRAPCLQMKSKEFVNFILKISKRWGWANKASIKKREIQGYHPVYSIRLNSRSVKEIYGLSGPCADIDKDKEFKHAISLRKPGSHRKIGQTKGEIIRLVEKNINTAKQISFELGIGIHNIRSPLLELVKEEKLKREKISRGYIYKLK
jgi:DNA-binding HxlR family transcriptional regulator